MPYDSTMNTPYGMLSGPVQPITPWEEFQQPPLPPLPPPSIELQPLPPLGINYEANSQTFPGTRLSGVYRDQGCRWFIYVNGIPCDLIPYSQNASPFPQDYPPY